MASLAEAGYYNTTLIGAAELPITTLISLLEAYMVVMAPFIALTTTLIRHCQSLLVGWNFFIAMASSFRGFLAMAGGE